MPDDVKIVVNTMDLRIKREKFLRLSFDIRRFGPILWEIFHRSKEQTFREEGVPSGSWRPLKKSTQKAYARIGALAGHKMLIGPRHGGRLKSSINWDTDGKTRILIGTNVIYGRIHQLGGRAGRKHAAAIRPRPFLVFRPGDDQRLARGADKVAEILLREAGL